MESRVTSLEGTSALKEIAAFEGLDPQHDEIWNRRCSGFPLEYLQRNGVVHSKAKMRQWRAKRRGTASYLLFTSLDHAASHSKRLTHTNTRNTARRQAGSPPTAFAWITGTAAELNAFGPTVQRNIKKSLRKSTE